jgi:hypothetical protein
MRTQSVGIVDDLPRSRTGRRLRLLIVCLLDCCAATAWFVPYESTFWRDWRTDVRLSHLDAELRHLVAELRSGDVPPVVE